MIKFWRYIAVFISSSCFIGYIPKVRGTAGSIVGLFLAYLLPSEHILFLAGVIVFFFALAPIAHAAEIYFGKVDDQHIVIDEVLGCMLACALLPRSPFYFIAAFSIFRFFDIFKPGVINKSQRLPYGLGVMADDLLAGLAANITLQIFRIICVKCSF